MLQWTNILEKKLCDHSPDSIHYICLYLLDEGQTYWSMFPKHKTIINPYKEDIMVIMKHEILLPLKAISLVHFYLDG